MKGDFDMGLFSTNKKPDTSEESINSTIENESTELSFTAEELCAIVEEALDIYSKELKSLTVRLVIAEKGTVQGFVFESLYAGMTLGIKDYVFRKVFGDNHTKIFMYNTTYIKPVLEGVANVGQLGAAYLLTTLAEAFPEVVITDEMIERVIKLEEDSTKLF